ncbi:hypothetical protein OCEANICA350_12724 [Oceanicaulis sp. 350]|nr:hypothetical protein OCEANICA350_12724 [Oceanicaulis sp. 350]
MDKPFLRPDATARIHYLCNLLSDAS